jgi:thiosulfate/3-mercaptopyruvate sulfurtransferase
MPMLRLILPLIIAMAVSSVSAVAEPWKKLIAPAELVALIETGPVTVIDIRGPKAYAAGHVAGALSAPFPTWRGPRANPGFRLSDDRLTERLQSLGIGPGTRVVVTYSGRSATSFGAAAWVYWTLKSAGLTEIAILNGGMKSWNSAGMALSTEPVATGRSDVSFSLSGEWRITRAGVRQVLDGAREAVLLDARPIEYYRGLKKNRLARSAGTLPGARSLEHTTWFTTSKTEMSPPGRVIKLAAEAGYVPGMDPELVSFCNTGIWASTNWFALSEIVGIEGVKLYPESVVGWSISGGELVNGE